MITKIRETIEKYSLLCRRDSLLLAVSGGPDSVCMFFIFNILKKEFHLNIGVGYFHHGIRTESDKELIFVKNLARKFNYPFYWQKKNIPDIAKKKKRSLEEIARIERYDFLIQVAKRNGYSKIAIAHNRDDVVETFLHRLIRGAGLKGLKGISPVIEIKGIKVIRPLIECSREDIEAYLKKIDVTSCSDSSNYDRKFTRNKIRWELLPYLEKEFNPNIKEVIFHTAGNIHSASNFIENKIENSVKRYVKKKDSYVKIRMDKLKKSHTYEKSEVIRKAIEMVKGNLNRFEYKHFKEIEELINYRPQGSVVDLPQNIWVKKEKTWLIIGRYT